MTTPERLTLLLTFDHELHLGGVTSYEQNLFGPTRELLRTARDLGVSVNLFTDVLCAMRYQTWDPEGFFDPYRRQIAQALRERHDVQLHLHPHWVDSGYENGHFVPSRNFALSDFRDREPPDDIRSIVLKGRDFLVDLCRRTVPDYVCIAYRAGGYNLAPETERILSALHEAGIRIDSTMAKGYTFRSGLSRVDYRDIPRHANWFIAPGGPLNRAASDGILEIPIAARPLNPISNIPYRLRQIIYLREIKRRRYRSGGFMIHEGNRSPGDKIRELFFPSTVNMLGFDSATFTVDDLMGILRYHLRKHRAEKEIIVSAISHPKVMGSYHRDLMSGFVERARATYRERLEFCTFREVHERVSQQEARPSDA